MLYKSEKDSFNVQVGVSGIRGDRSTSDFTRPIVTRMLTAQSRVSTALDLGPGANSPQSVFNIMKNMIGSGVLGLPSGLALGTGVFPAVVIASVLGAICGYAFSNIGRVCSVTGQKTWKGCGSATGGPLLANAMAIVCVLKTFLGCVSWSIVIADSFSGIFRGFGVPEPFSSRTYVLVGMTLFVLFPMCLIKDLSVLGYTSLAGITGIVYTSVFMLIRCIDGSYAPGGIFYDSLKQEFQPDFSHGVNLWGIDIKSLAFMCGLSTAYVCHYNAPRFYDELRNNTMPRFNRTVFLAFAAVCAVNSWMMVAGYLTFGAATQGNILNNYSDNDSMATLARLGVGGSVLCGYPILFTGLRESLLTLLGWERTNKIFYASTASIVSLVTVLAYFIHSLGLLNNFAGAVLGSYVIYVFPMVCFLLAVKKGFMHVSHAESLLVKCFVCMGVLLSLLGGYTSLVH